MTNFSQSDINQNHLNNVMKVNKKAIVNWFHIWHKYEITFLKWRFYGILGRSIPQRWSACLIACVRSFHTWPSPPPPPRNNYMIFFFVGILLRMYSIMLFLPISSSFLFYFANNFCTFVFVLFSLKYLNWAGGVAQW